MQEWLNNASDLFWGQQRGLLKRWAQSHPLRFGYLGDGQQVVFASSSLEERQAREHGALCLAQAPQGVLQRGQQRAVAPCLGIVCKEGQQRRKLCCELCQGQRGCS